MFKRIRNKYLPIGLDWSSTALRAIQLVRRENTLHVHSALECILPQEEAHMGVLDIDTYTSSDPEQLSEALWRVTLERLMKRGNFAGRDVVLHCRQDKIDMRPLSIPAPAGGLPRDAVLGAIKLQIAHHLAYPIDQAVYDYVVLEHDHRNARMTVMAYATEAKWIKNRIAMLASLGLRCSGIDTLPCALSRVVFHNRSHSEETNTKASDTHDELRGNQPASSPKEPIIAILDIGYSGSSLVVSSQRGPVLCRRFQLGGRELTQTISQRMMIQYPQAEQIKILYGLDTQARHFRYNVSDTGKSRTALAECENPIPNTDIAKTIFTSLQGELTNLAEGIIRTLNYVITEHQNTCLTKIALCGSAGMTKNLDTFLAGQFELPVEIITHPLLDEIIPNLPESRSNRGAWATALGLALARETV
ncbi:MAG: pilus assembly protein PilM [Sedimentisphaerales bacterium]|nr:pilus assembly protein PilM [Sedimentisphaerales bacterium]